MTGSRKLWKRLWRQLALARSEMGKSLLCRLRKRLESEPKNEVRRRFNLQPVLSVETIQSLHAGSACKREAASRGWRCSQRDLEIPTSSRSEARPRLCGFMERSDVSP